MYTPQAGESGMLLHRKGKLTIAKFYQSINRHAQQREREMYGHVIFLNNACTSI
jgi:hypothetical protein